MCYKTAFEILLVVLNDDPVGKKCDREKESSRRVSEKIVF